MASPLEAIGRTNTLRAVTGDLRDMARQNRQDALQEKQFALKEKAVNSELANQALKRQTAQEEAKIKNKPIPIDSIRGVFQTPAAADYAQKLATAMGAVEDIGGVPTIRAGTAKEIYEVLNDPQHMKVIGNLNIQHYRNQVGQLQEQLNEMQQGGKDLSNDKKAMTIAQQLKQAQQGLLSSLEETDRVSTYMDLIEQGYDVGKVQQAMQSGDMSVLGTPSGDASGLTDVERYVNRANEQSVEEFGKPLTPGEQNAKALEFKRQTAEQAGAIQRQKGLAKAETAGAEEESKATGKGVAENNLEQYDAAAKAVAQIQDIDRLINHLNTSDAITGLGADLFKNIERAKTLLGSKAAAGKVSDTELLDTMMGSEVFPMIKSLGVGARGLDTPAEREFMRQVLTGSLSLNKETLLKMAEIRKNVANRAIEKWNRRTESGELDRFYNAAGLPKKTFEVKGGEQPPVKGAKKAPDGNWYIQQNGEYFRVDK